MGLLFDIGNFERDGFYLEKKGHGRSEDDLSERNPLDDPIFSHPKKKKKGCLIGQKLLLLVNPVSDDQQQQQLDVCHTKDDPTTTNPISLFGEFFHSMNLKKREALFIETRTNRLKKKRGF